jgi:hypothetical protein
MRIIGPIITFIFFIWILLGCIIIFLFDLMKKDIRDIK